MITCAKCGTKNVEGDAFCGNCGAFLEFAAEEAADGAESGMPAAPAEGAAGMPPSPAAPAVAAPHPPAAASPGPAEPGPPGPTCSACGRVNPAGRRFCISCGERLPAAPTTTIPGAGPATPPGAGPAARAWEFPTAAVPAAEVLAGAPAPAAPASGGRSRLALVGAAVVVVVVLVAGGAVLVLGGGSGGTPGTTASPLPSAALASATPGADSSTEPTTPPETPGPTGTGSSTPAPTAPPATIPPGPSVGIKITGAKGSSQLKAERGPKFLFDGSPATTWKSASGKFQGAWVEVRFAPAAITRIQVWTGWQKSEPLFYGNHRPQNVTVSFDGGDPVPLELQDALGAQRIDIPPELGIVRATRVRITIADVYPARKTSAQDSPTKEVAISEIRLYGIPVAP